MTVLVTGGTGAIGSNVARQLITSGHEVVVFDRVPLGPGHGVLGSLDKLPESEVGSVADLAVLLDVVHRHNVDGIKPFVHEMVQRQQRRPHAWTTKRKG